VNSKLTAVADQHDRGSNKARASSGTLLRTARRAAHLPGGHQTMAAARHFSGDLEQLGV